MSLHRYIYNIFTKRNQAVLTILEMYTYKFVLHIIILLHSGQTGWYTGYNKNPFSPSAADDCLSQ
jgi:hypothetical protein